jgi:hypothetical protein
MLDNQLMYRSRRECGADHEKRGSSMEAPQVTPGPRRTKLEPGIPPKDEGPSTAQRDAIHGLIGKHVIERLGSPGDLLRVQVRPVGGDRYRVNIVVGKNVTSSKIVQSFFLVADGEGNIVSSSPTIARVY